MSHLNPKIDLRDSKWREHPDEFWKVFLAKGSTTNDIRVPERFSEWIIGQDEALHKIELIMLEWLRTLKDIQALEEQQLKGFTYSKVLKERPTQNLLLLGMQGTGKCYARGQEILMADGSIKKIENIIVGDAVMGPDGNPRNVLSLARGRDSMTKIIPTKGIPFVVTQDHVLVLTGNSQYEGQIIETTVNDWMRWNKSKKKRFTLFRVGVDFQNKLVGKISPYLLGLLLGDGSLATTPCITTANQEIWQILPKEIKPFGLHVTFSEKIGTLAMNCYLSGKKKKPNPLTAELQVLGLRYTTAGDKFVPFEYKVATRNERLELLAGLIDTDGSYDVRGNVYDYISKSQTLANDVVFIVRSLGLAAYVAPCYKTDQNGHGGIYYRVCISGDIDCVPVRVRKKQARPRRQIKDVQRVGFEVEEIGIDDFYGFQTDGDSRHLLADFTVSHNSLVIKVAAEKLKETYKQEGIELEDVVLTENRTNKYAPLVRYLKPAGLGKKILEYAQVRESLKGKRKFAGIVALLGAIMLIGALFMSLGMRQLVLGLLAGYDLNNVIASVGNVYFSIGATMLIFPMFILFMFVGGSSMMSGTLNREYLAKIPNLIVDNNPQDTEMYENVTIASEGLLFGEIEWAAYGSSDKAPYLRVQAGKIHKANKKILYIDEIRNLTEGAAIKMLTAMEDGEMPIQGQQGANFSSGGASGQQNVQTPPIKAMFFLMAAGNLDVIYDATSILNRLPALRDRFENYGDIIMLRDEVEATPLNEMLIAQVVRDELYRFNFPPMEADGVSRIIRYVKARASDKNHIKLMFRAVIKVLKKSAQLSWESGDTIIRLVHVDKAIEFYVSSIERQVLEHQFKKREPLHLMDTKGSLVGVVNGLTVSGVDTYHEGAGQVVRIESVVKFVDDSEHADFVTTGVVEKSEATDVKDSIREVRTVINQLYGIDLAKQCYVHIKFSQTRVDGPSAGISMTLALMSWLGDPLTFKQKWALFKRQKRKLSEFQLDSVKMRQDIAITGALQIAEYKHGDIPITAIGGLPDKIRGARRAGMKVVVCPESNFVQQIDARDYPNIRILSGDSILSYFNMVTDKRSELDI
jgi:lon-related putative ATP-dependent protease